MATVLRILAILFCCLLVLPSQSHGAESLSDVLMVGTSASTITTVLGCMESFVCEGEGTNIVWRIVGTREDVINSTDRLVTISRNGSRVTSHLVFVDVMPDHDATYVCNILNDITRRTLTLSARLTVNNTRAYIEPPENIDISNNTVGDTISIGCSIQTCATSIDVSILKGSQSIRQNKNITDNVVLLNYDLVIMEDTPDMYACTVLANGQLHMARFNITGTPQSAPTLPITPTDGSSTTTNATPTLYRVHYPLLFSLLVVAVFTLSKL